MNRKLLAVGIVLMMCAVPFVMVKIGGSDADPVPGTIVTHPYEPRNGNSKTWISDGAIVYDGSYHPNRYYFSEDPTDDIDDVIKGNRLWDDLTKVDSPTAGNSYWCVGFGNDDTVFAKTYVTTTPDVIYLKAGTYTVEIVGTNCVRNEMFRISFENISDILGEYSSAYTFETSVNSKTISPDTDGGYQFRYNGPSGPWLDYWIEYRITPAPQFESVSEYPSTAKIHSNYAWKAATIENVTGTVDTAYYPEYLYFEKDSPAETAFLADVMNNGIVDGSAHYGGGPLVLDSGTLRIYELVSSRDNSSMYYRIDHGSGYATEYAYSPFEYIQPGEETGARFMAKGQFSIAVDYHTAEVMFVALSYQEYGTYHYVPLQSGKLYSFAPENLRTYNLVSYTNTAPSSLSVMEIGLYTSGISGGSSASEGNSITHPYNTNCTIWVSKEKVTYDYSHSDWMYFAQNPTDDLKKVLSGEMSFMDLSPVTPSYGNKYWIAGFNNNYNTSFAKEYLLSNPDLIYLEKGTWTINVVRTDCSSLSLYNANYLIGGDDDSKRIDLAGGRGSVKVELERPTAFFFNSYGGGDAPWISFTIEYNIDPLPEKKEVTDYSDKATVLTNYQWVKMTTQTSLDGRVAPEYGSYIFFVQGSPEEAAFVENVVKKNKTNGSDYSQPYVDVHSRKVVCYSLSRIDGHISSTIYLRVNPNFDDLSGPDTTHNQYAVSSERIPTGENSNSQFYAGKKFSMSVRYDTDRILYVAIAFTNLWGDTDYAPLESGRLYEFEMESAAEYEIYALLKDGAEDMGPVEVDIYTSGIAEKDDYGYIFAIVAIALCVLAFGTLFMAGRRPKWSEDTGLPKHSGSAVSEDFDDSDLDFEDKRE